MIRGGDILGLKVRLMRIMFLCVFDLVRGS